MYIKIPNAYSKQNIISIPIRSDVFTFLNIVSPIEDYTKYALKVYELLWWKQYDYGRRTFGIFFQDTIMPCIPA